MKARVKATGEIIEVIQVGTKSHLFDLNNVEFIDAPEDYWTRLEHQYAGMTMQGLLSNLCITDEIDKEGIVTKPLFIVEMATAYAHALVEKMKEDK